MEVTREVFWRTHIQAWEGSGQTRKAYCHAHDLNHHTFDHWRTKLRRKNDQDQDTPALTRVPLTVAAAPSVIEVHSGSDLILRVPSSVSPHWLAELVRGLRGC
jgi:transposase-like protein